MRRGDAIGKHNASDRVASFRQNTSKLMNTPLPDIDEIAPLSEKDARCMKELKAVLRKHHSLGRFGVTLLHQHFEVADDEILVEECDAVGRRLTIAPQRLTALGVSRSIATNWRLDTDAVMAKCIQVCPKDPDFPGRHKGKKRHL